ncbi:MAG: signal peptidase I [Hyphomicrobiales bacterium]|nr:signal peptidase I [Hyphomicrobiales bacterium]
MQSRLQKEPYESAGGELVKIAIQALLIAAIVRVFLFQPFAIPSGSMIPTLLVGDYLIVSKYSYGYSRYSFPFAPNFFHGRLFGDAPKRGDVVVFKLPSDSSKDYIKRIVGLPGDKLQMKDGRLFINGQIVQRAEATKARTEDFYGHVVDVPTYTETLPGGFAHTIIEIQGDVAFNDNTGVFEVPADHYFMMGDNRDNSSDSRADGNEGGVGMVPLANIIGRAQIVFFSVKKGEEAWRFWKWPQTVRFERIFTQVR